jgi:small nuclear ribonucleoprotein G
MHSMIYYIKDKRLKISLNGKRTIIGTLRGYDAFLNIVLEHVEDIHTGQYYGTDIVVRGNSIIQFEAMDRIVVGGTTSSGTTATTAVTAPTDE